MYIHANKYINISRYIYLSIYLYILIYIYILRYVYILTKAACCRNIRDCTTSNDIELCIYIYI